MGGKDIKYEQASGHFINNVNGNNIINTNGNIYNVENVTNNKSNIKEQNALVAYLASTGKTAAQLAREVSTTVSNVKKWLDGGKIEMEYWVQLKPLLEQFIDRPDSNLYYEADKDKKEEISVDEALLVRNYRKLLPYQKLKLLKEIEQMEIDNLDQRWNNVARLREKPSAYTADKKTE